MLNFEAELNKLLSRETGMLPQYEFAELAAAGQELLAELNKKQTDVSLQIEEIYDLVKEQDTRLLQETLDTEKAQSNRLASAAISLCDLLDDFYAYARQSGNEELRHQAGILWKKSGGILAGCGIFRFGEEGQPFNPQIHTVKASAESPFPREHVIQVLQSGYVYQNALVRKAAVVLSRGQNDPIENRYEDKIEIQDIIESENIQSENQYEDDGQDQHEGEQRE
jgi:molecular chaperone GrpE (heat shock protein)